jgi:aminoglycoside 3-N-acetyltransferase
VEPEKGNPKIKVRREDVAQAARDVGIVPGDTVMFHSSLSSMGRVVGGANTVIDGFLEAVGPEGTVAVPTLWWHQTDPPMRMEDWDPDTSPSYPGLITETFR